MSKQAEIEWQERFASAQRRVNMGRWSREEADARLFPWLSVALRAGARPPEAAAMLAEIAAEVGAPANPAALAAIRLCPTADMRAELAKARDSALAAALQAPADLKASERSTRLQFLALYLGCGMPAAIDDDERIAA